MYCACGATFGTVQDYAEHRHSSARAEPSKKQPADLIAVALRAAQDRWSAYLDHEAPIHTAERVVKKAELLAVLDAIREPTEAMTQWINQCKLEISRWSSRPEAVSRWTADPTWFATLWRSMIDVKKAEIAALDVSSRANQSASSALPLDET